MSNVQTGPCEDCGATVERPALEGIFARIAEGIPLRCSNCEGKQVEQWAAEDAEREYDAELKAREHRVATAGIPRALRGIDLDALDPTGCGEAIESARYWSQRGGGLLLTGPFGTGKTTIAAGALRLALERRHGRWTSAPLLMARLGSGLDSRERHEAVSTLTGTTALVLDDLDKTRPTEYGAEQIFLAVDGSVTNDRALLVTTNLGLGQLAAKWPAPFGEAIASRLAGYCKVVQVKGADRRLGGRP